MKLKDILSLKFLGNSKSKKKSDLFRIREVSTERGDSYFFPEYIHGFLSYSSITLINNKVYRLMPVADDFETALGSKKEAEDYIEGYKRQLANDRANNIAKEVILSVD